MADGGGRQRDSGSRSGLALHAFLHLTDLPGHLPCKDPVELGEGETFPWELEVRKLNARDKGSVEEKASNTFPCPCCWQVGPLVAQVCAAFGTSGAAWSRLTPPASSHMPGWVHRVELQSSAVVLLRAGTQAGHGSRTELRVPGSLPCLLLMP